MWLFISGLVIGLLIGKIWATLSYVKAFNKYFG